jgi:hypothetical protein
MNGGKAPGERPRTKVTGTTEPLPLRAFSAHGRGGTGRRARLRIWYRKVWGFESPRPYFGAPEAYAEATCSAEASAKADIHHRNRKLKAGSGEHPPFSPK